MMLTAILSVNETPHSSVECTWATGGKANLRESSGVPLYSSSCSSSVWPSSAYAGRLYCATNESMVASVCVAGVEGYGGCARRRMGRAGDVNVVEVVIELRAVVRNAKPSPRQAAAFCLSSLCNHNTQSTLSWICYVWLNTYDYLS
jgi:hypothetical protein